MNSKIEMLASKFNWYVFANGDALFNIDRAFSGNVN